MLRRLVRDPWTYLWSVLGVGCAVGLCLILTGCSGMEVSYKSGSIDPGAVVKGLGAAGKVAGALGFPWLEAGLTALGTILGGVGVTSRVMKAKIAAHDEAPFVGADGQIATEAEIVAAAKKPSA